MNMKWWHEYDDDDDDDEMEQTTYLEIIGCPFVGYIINNWIYFADPFVGSIIQFRINNNNNI